MERLLELILIVNTLRGPGSVIRELERQMRAYYYIHDQAFTVRSFFNHI